MTTTVPATTTSTSTALSIRAEQEFWDERQLAALSQLGLQRAPKGDLAVFFHQAKRTGLDPFARQIYMIERKGRYGIQTSIDGFRVIADRACASRSWVRSEEDTVWYDASGATHVVPIKQPVAARYTCVVLTPAGQARFSATARFDEYSAGGPMWSKMPGLMIAKCAEALALRKAFPQDLSGIYTDEEMAQADDRTRSRVVTPKPKQDNGAYEVVDAEVIEDINTQFAPVPEEPAIPEGHVVVKSAQFDLVKIYTEAGLDTGQAKILAKSAWTSSGLPMSGTVASADVEKLFSAVTAELDGEVVEEVK